MNGASEARWESRPARRISLYPIVASFLLLALLENLVWVLVLELPGVGHSWLAMLAALGLLLGWLLARSRLNGPAAGSISLAAGAAIVFLRFGALGSSLSGLLSRLPQALAQAIWTEEIAPLGELVPYLEAVWNSLSLPFIRLYRWAQAQGGPEVITDPFVTALLASTLVFALAVWAAWAVRRRKQPLAAILPPTLLMAVILYFDQADQFSLVFQLSGTLLLAALVNAAAREARWEQGGIEYAEDVRYDWAWIVVAMVLIISMAARLAPSLSISRMREISQQILGERASQAADIAKSIGLEPKAAPFNPFRGLFSPGLPRAHLLGSGPELSERAVMAIQVAGVPADPPMESASDVPRFYWRGLAFDTYTGRGWRTSQIKMVAYDAGEANPAEPMPGGVEVRQKVRILGEIESDEEAVLYAAGLAVNANQDRQIAWRSNQDAFGQVGGRPIYEAVSIMNAAAEEALRGAGEAYPEWVRRRYLSLPKSVPDRVRALAIDLTAAQPTPYDRAEAIEEYLRRIPYSLDVPLPPTGRDVSDYFLFELKRGFCDYYATAMVVLARAAGLPARLVMGYAGGEYDLNSQQYVISAADAHSWVEVFFPDYGWVTFEPTGSRPAIQRGAAGSALEPAPDFPAAEPADQPPFRPGSLPWKTMLIAALLGAAAVTLIWIVASRVWISALRPATAIRTIYQRLLRRGAGLEISRDPGRTPYEFSAELSGRLKSIGQIAVVGQALQAGISDLGKLTDTYVNAAYGPHPPKAQDKARAVQAWNRLSWRLWLARKLERLRGKGV